MYDTHVTSSHYPMISQNRFLGTYSQMVIFPIRQSSPHVVGDIPGRWSQDQLEAPFQANLRSGEDM